MSVAHIHILRGRVGCMCRLQDFFEVTTYDLSILRMFALFTSRHYHRTCTCEKSMKRIYLDYASLTPVDTAVIGVMDNSSKGSVGNPSAIHSEGVHAKRVLESTRKRVAEELHALPDEIIFTASGTEANNLAIMGLFKQVVLAGRTPNKLHAVTSVIEHASVRECFRHLSELGVSVDVLPVDKKGYVDPRALRKFLRVDTFLVSVTHVNNEIGTIEPITEIARSVRHSRKSNTLDPKGTFPFFHTDACQSALCIELDVRRLGADLVVLDGSKLYGPRGVGCLWKRRPIKLAPMILGGGQESGLRSGTENVPAIAGFAESLSISSRMRSRETSRLRLLRSRFITELERVVSNVVLHGDVENGAPHIVNFSIPGINNEFLVLQLDARGIAVSTKSACLRDEDESYVVASLGKGREIARTSIRVSFGRGTTWDNLRRFIAVLLTSLEGGQTTARG